MSRHIDKLNVQTWSASALHYKSDSVVIYYNLPISYLHHILLFSSSQPSGINLTALPCDPVDMFHENPGTSNYPNEPLETYTGTLAVGYPIWYCVAPSPFPPHPFKPICAHIISGIQYFPVLIKLISTNYYETCRKIYVLVTTIFYIILARMHTKTSI